MKKLLLLILLLPTLSFADDFKNLIKLDGMPRVEDYVNQNCEDNFECLRQYERDYESWSKNWKMKFDEAEKKYELENAKTQEEERRKLEKENQEKVQRKIEADIAREIYLNSDEYKNKQAKKLKIETKCSKESAKAKSDVGASTLYANCLKRNKYYE